MPLLQKLVYSALIYSSLLFSGDRVTDVSHDKSKGVEVTVAPQGEYATIDTKESLNMIEILTGKNSSDKLKRKTIEKIDTNPGSYNPFVLLAAAIYYMSQNDFNKSAFYNRLGYFRTMIDGRIAKDRSLGDVPSIYLERIAEAKLIYLDTPEKQQAWSKAFSEANDKLVEHDQTIPRNYDQRWICLHSVGYFSNKPLIKISEEEKKEIIQNTHDEFKKLMAQN